MGIRRRVSTVLLSTLVAAGVLPAHATTHPQPAGTFCLQPIDAVAEGDQRTSEEDPDQKEQVPHRISVRYAGTAPATVTLVVAEGTARYHEPDGISGDFGPLPGPWVELASQGGYRRFSRSISTTEAGTLHIEIPIVDDSLSEGDERYFIGLQDGPIASETYSDADCRVSREAKILDDDLRLAVGGPSHVTEGSGGALTPVEYTVRIPNARDVDVRFQWWVEKCETKQVTPDECVADGTPAEDDDWQGPTKERPAEGAIPRTRTEAKVVVFVRDDDVDEPRDVYVVRVAEPPGQTPTYGSGVAVTTIVDDDDPPVLLMPPPAPSFTEGNVGDATYDVTVYLVGLTEFDVKVRYDTAPNGQNPRGTAQPGQDYAPTAGEWDFGANHPPAPGQPQHETQRSRRATVTIRGDQEPEPAETFWLNLDGRPGGVGTTQFATVLREEPIRITDDDSLAIAAADVDHVEGSSGLSLANVTVTRWGPSTYPITFTYATVDGDAQNPRDYVRTTGQATIPSNTGSTTIQVPVVADTVQEPHRHFFVQLTDARSGSEKGEVKVPIVTDHPDGKVRVTILDDDGETRVAVGNPSVVEGDEGGTSLVFPVSVAGSRPSDTVIRYSTDVTGSTASAGADYTPVAGEVRVSRTAHDEVILVPVRGDTVDEEHETVILQWEIVSGATTPQGPQTATGTIQDDDSTVSILPGSVAEGDAGLRQLPMAVQLANPSVRDVTVRFEPSSPPGTATKNQDYVVLDESARVVTIPAGQTSGELQVPVVGDTEVEGDETFTVSLTTTAPGDRLGTQGSAIATIIDDDVPSGGTTGGTTDGGSGGTTDGGSGGTTDGGSGGTTAGGTTGDDHAGGRDPANAGPTVSAGPNRMVDSFSTVTFTASASDPQGKGFTYRWDFGDGSVPVDGQSVSHTYTRRGTFTVRVTATTTDARSAVGQATVQVIDGGELTRVSGPDRVGTSVAASQAHWPARSAGRSASRASTAPATDAVLARADDFADALSAGALVASLDAPLLLTPRDRLASSVKDELARLGVATVWLLGGTAALSGGIETELAMAGYSVRRIGGADRFETARLVALEAGASPSGDVVLALGSHEDAGRAWPDALSAGALTASPDRLPLVLTTRDRLPAPTEAALRELGASRVILLGGSSAIATSVEQRLQQLGYATTRLGGADRFATSALVAAEALRRHPTSGQVPVVAATGLAFPDGLAAGAVAARLGGLVVLVPRDDLPAGSAVRTWLEGRADRIDHARVLGGTAAVSTRVADQIRQAIRAG